MFLTAKVILLVNGFGSMTVVKGVTVGNEVGTFVGTGVAVVVAEAVGEIDGDRGGDAAGASQLERIIRNNINGIKFFVFIFIFPYPLVDFMSDSFPSNDVRISIPISDLVQNGFLPLPGRFHLIGFDDP
jgi:hypothetical protein